MGDAILPGRVICATALLNDKLGLTLTDAELTLLQQRTEGWVAGLRLLAGSLVEQAGASDRATLLPHLARGNRAVTEVLLEEEQRRSGYPIIASGVGRANPVDSAPLGMIYLFYANK
jgi:hypothetical protein